MPQVTQAKIADRMKCLKFSFNRKYRAPNVRHGRTENGVVAVSTKSLDDFELSYVLGRVAPLGFNCQSHASIRVFYNIPMSSSM
ncbi:hypothetical protein [Dyadobacter sp. LHD-138]|uniref:hypothetical protein n=1 Tax=Dyadobacter sp. LHD-138 TaxID=3071413 RepID=UPI0027DFB070|nr:hypothetical protein [Dyadobacter sp. LHD-138]MDQ6481706.1 hypothetical protein [Dyadobacter sp. LHD-138]